MNFLTALLSMPGGAYRGPFRQILLFPIKVLRLCPSANLITGNGLRVDRCQVACELACVASGEADLHGEAKLPRMREILRLGGQSVRLVPVGVTSAADDAICS